ncbi:DUF4249 family protein [Marinilabilia rubra]|uniref:DUF4249 domain-containing protein n=1 Tax=Marinilabilia rubra TaxID=2162893 RepID=A0A2U2B846_9BACT|nr:DUF4249 family protein [Marinilabilia rubra]PWD99239.1 DUF4249 domain-containing protein [Marinilabilia rubra]
MRFALSILLLLVFVSCTKEVDLDQPFYERQIVVDGYIETDRPAHVFLTLSTPYLTHYDSASIRSSFLNYAKITLSSSKGEDEVLTIFREKAFFPPFVYKSVEMKGEEGVQYDLKVEVFGRTITAVTTIPEVLPIEETRVKATSDTTGFLEFAVKPSGQKIHYYFSRIASRLEDDDLHPSYEPMELIKGEGGNLIWNRLLRSTETSLYLEDSVSDFYSDYPRFEYDLRDTVKLMVGTVDSVSYKVLNSLFTDRANQENPFAFNGNSIQSNIKDGIGRWTGIGISGVKEVVLKEQPSAGDME